MVTENCAATITRKRISTTRIAISVLGYALSGCANSATTQSTPAPATPAATPMSSMSEGGLPPGRYTVQFAGADPDAHVAQVDVPKGFETWNGNVLWAAGAGTGALMFRTVDRLPPDPCHAEWEDYVEPGPSVEDLADALLAQEGRRGSTPRPVSLEGHNGLYLEFNVPGHLDVDKCVGDSYDTWAATSVFATRRPLDHATASGSSSRRSTIAHQPRTGTQQSRQRRAPGMFDSIELVKQ